MPVETNANKHTLIQLYAFLHTHFVFSFMSKSKKKTENTLFCSLMGMHVSTSMTVKHTVVSAEGELPRCNVGIARQTGANWHEWAWQQLLCG